jgi:type IV secretion/conjugal transfer VirB4 family ATPase
MLRLREFRSNLKGLPDLLNYAVLVDDGVILNKDGSLMSGFYFRGPDLESSTEEELITVSAQINAALIKLGNGWMLNVDSIRIPAMGYVPIAKSFFTDPTTAVIDEERRLAHATEGAHYENVYVLLVTYQAPADIENRLASFFVEDEDEARKSDRMDYTKLLRKYKAITADIAGALSTCLKLTPMNSGDILSHLHYCITGLSHKVAVPGIPMYLDALLGSKDFLTGIAPKIGSQNIRVITVAGFPNITLSGILDTLNVLPYPYRWSTRFIALDPAEALSVLNVYRRNWFQKRHGLMGMLKAAMGQGEQTFTNTDAVRMAADADEAYTEASEGTVRYGYYTSVLVIMHEQSTAADDIAADIAKALGNLGFPSQVETINAVEAYLGSLPGHAFPNVRRPLLHTLNLSHLLPTTSIWAGPESNPCPFYPPDSPPLLYAATTGSTPFRIALHEGDVGHTVIIGPTGAGKSTLLNLIVAQHFRYPNAQVFMFDKGYSSFILANAASGDHYDIAGDSGQLAFCPLASLESDADRAWAKEYVEFLVILQYRDGDVLSPAQRQEIHHAIERLAANTTDSADRTLTHLKNTIQNQALRDAIGYYTVDGSLGHLLDAEQDSLREGRFQVFEMEHLMGMGEKAVLPVLLYLFRRIEKRLSGAPTLLVLDEAWAMIRHPMFREKIREWLKVLRKANAAVVFATQSISDITNSPIADVIVESTPTKIFLPNPEAVNDSASGFYRQLGLNSRQISMIATAVKKRHYFIMNSQGRRMFNLGLGPGALAFIGTSGKEDIARVRQLMNQFDNRPENWVPAWMEECQVPRALIEYWENFHHS